MPEKDFEKWFKRKLEIHSKGHRPFVHEREVWWCYLGINIGSEQDGKGENSSRPVLIYRKFSNRICWIIPLTTSAKQNALYIPIDIEDKISRFALIHQMQSIDIKRLYNFMGRLTDRCHETITKVVSQISGPDWDTKTSEAAPLDAAPRPTAEAIVTHNGNPK